MNKTITIKIPQWVLALSYEWKKLKFRLNPHRCVLCGARQYVAQPHYEYTFPNGRRLTVQNVATHGSAEGFKAQCVCRDCLVKQLESQEWKPRFHHMTPGRYVYKYWTAKKCYITDAQVRSYKDVEIYPHVSMLFCAGAWNFNYVSKQVVIDCVRYGKISTSIFGVHKGRMVCQTTHGLFINNKGELL